MAYIGQQPVVGRYIKIDQISGGFNGTASGFTLAAGGQGVLPGTARNLMLSLGGVIQEPETDFTVSGSGLTFTTPPVSGTTFFAVVFGDMQAVGTPSDNTVTPATISPTGTFVFPNVTVSGTTVIASGTAAVPSLSVTGDSNTGLFSPGSDQLSITAGGTERVKLGTTEVVFNDSGNDVDFRVEGDTNANLLFIDASTDRVGLGTSSPETLLDLQTGAIRVKTGAAVTSAEYDLLIGYSGNADYNAKITTIQGSSSTRHGLRFYTSNAALPVARLSITEAGLVGIGTIAPDSLLHCGTTSAADNVAIKVQNASATDSAASASIVFTQGANYAAGEIRSVRLGNYSATAANQDSALAFYTANDGANGERARIDSSGRLLVGTSSALTVDGNAGVQKLQIAGTVGDASLSISRFANAVNGSDLTLAKSRGASVGTNTVVAADDALGNIRFTGADGTGFIEAARIRCEVDGTPGTNDMPGRLVFSTTADGASSPTEHVRIASNGITYIGDTTITTSSQQTTAPHAIIYSNGSTNLLAAGGLECNTTSTSARHHISFTNPNGVVGSISTSASATAYNTSSDYRLKENVVPLTGAIDRLQQIPVHRFNFIADSGRTVDGFIAHEAQAVVPECVTGTKDEVDNDGNPVYQGIDQSKLVPLLTAALQEAIGEIKSLKARVAALEGA